MADRPPDLDHVAWIKSLKAELRVSWDDLARKIGAPLNTLNKWKRDNKPQEPSFSYARRMVTVAPLRLIQAFVGRPEIWPDSQVSDPRTKVLGAEVPTVNPIATQWIADRLNAIEDDNVRARAVEACSAAIRKVLSGPSRWGAEKRPDRVSRK